MSGPHDHPAVREGRDVRGSHPGPPEPPCGCVLVPDGDCTVDCTDDCTDDCTIDAISLVGVCGGSGTSTIGAVLALFASRMVGVELVTENVKLTSALLGLGEPAESPAEVAPGLVLTTRSSGNAGLVVIDGGTLGSEQLTGKRSGERRIGVLRGPCYLALRVLMAAEHDLDGLILLAEPGRALNERDVADVAGLKVLATVIAAPAIARTVDAGLLACRYRNLTEFRPLRRWLTLQLDPFPTRRSHSRSAAPNHPSMSGTDLPLPPDGERGFG
jgi:hypothetical protein